MAALFSNALPKSLGVAVSGGSDSTALLHLMSDWCAPRDISLFVATVDHRLRAESASEARAVRRMCEAIGLPHATLVWEDSNHQGNLQDIARTARYGLLRDWAETLGVEAVATGHTEDDQAETFLMNLARGSGVDGLSGIAQSHRLHGVRVVRPLLGHTRSDLRAWLQGRDVGWIEDPSNEDHSYQRVRARSALNALAPLGLDTATLSATTLRLQAARKALGETASQVAEDVAREENGDLILKRAAFLALNEEMRSRILAAALVWVSSAPYRPRAKSLKNTLADIKSHHTATLHGCLIYKVKADFRISREVKGTMPRVVVEETTIWDNRWSLETGNFIGCEVKALGEKGLRALGAERPSETPRRALLALPSIWRGGRLIACSHLNFGPKHSVNLERAKRPFAASLLSH